MKWKIISALILIASIALFAYYNWDYYTNKDSLGPIISMDSGEIYLSVNDPDQQPLQGMTAMDTKDGDVTDLMLIESITGFIAENTRMVNYVAFDRDNHVSKVQRKMIYTDYTKPVFSLSRPLRYPAATTKNDYLGNLTVTDSLDGDISEQAAFSADSVINTGVPGDYKTTIEVTNSAGATYRLPATLTVYDSALETSVPKIQLTDYLVYTLPGERIDPIAMIESVSYRGTDYGITTNEGTFAVDTEDWSSDRLKEFRKRTPAVNQDKFTIMDMVNYHVPGTYEIQYSLEDMEGNRGSVNLIVIVEEEE